MMYCKLWKFLSFPPFHCKDLEILVIIYTTWKYTWYSRTWVYSVVLFKFNIQKWHWNITQSVHHFVTKIHKDTVLDLEKFFKYVNSGLVISNMHSNAATQLEKLCFVGNTFLLGLWKKFHIYFWIYCIQHTT